MTIALQVLSGGIVCVIWFNLQNVRMMNAIRPFIALSDFNFPISFASALMSSIKCSDIPSATGFGGLLI
jgi:hypothetical protein